MDRVERLIRIGDNEWATHPDFLRNAPGATTDTAVKQLYISTEKADYHIARIVANTLRFTGVPEAAKNTLLLKIPGSGNLVYKVVILKWKDSLADRIWKSIPFFHHYTRSDVATVKVTQYHKDPDRWTFRRKRERPFLLPCDTAYRAEEGKAVTLAPSAPNEAPFRDAFSRVAKNANKYWTDTFVTRRHHFGQHRLHLSETGTLSLKRIGDPSCEIEKEANRRTVQAYRQHLEAEVGVEELNYIQYRFEIDLKQMEETGAPLTPEHVYRMNVGQTNLEQQHLQALVAKLQQLREWLPQQRHEDYTELLTAAGTAPDLDLTMRELRGLYRVASSRAELSQWLDSILPLRLTTSCDLSPEQFNKLLAVLRIPPEEQKMWSHQFTGRLIQHLPISGFYTMDDGSGRTVFKPWLDQHELVQSFVDLRTNNWDLYLEQISHIACKKHLVRRHPTDGWRVGALIPAPLDSAGNQRWYRVDYCVDDDAGDFHYFLRPACQDNSLPRILLFRSTASDGYAMNGTASVLTDVNPLTSPGGSHHHAVNKYVLPYIKSCTVPLWTVYLQKAKREVTALREEVERNDALKSALDPASSMSDQDRFIHLSRQLANWRSTIKLLDRAMILMATSQINETRAKLTEGSLSDLEADQTERHLLGLTDEKRIHQRHLDRPFKVPDLMNAENLLIMQHQLEEVEKRALHIAQKLDKLRADSHEREQDKEASDVIFTGHSLGGSLAQSWLYHAVINLGRIPVNGHRYILNAMDAPGGVSPSEAREFTSFCHRHRKILKDYNHSWLIDHQFEYGDFVGEAGGMHLGGVNPDAQPEDQEYWTTFRARFVRPLPDAQHPAIRDILGAHGRRYHTGEEGRDYKATHFTAQGMHRFDTSWWLPRDLQETSGLHTPRGLNLMRRITGLAIYSVLRATEKLKELRGIKERGDEIRDDRRIFFCPYEKPVQIEEVPMTEKEKETRRAAQLLGQNRTGSINGIDSDRASIATHRWRVAGTASRFIGLSRAHQDRRVRIASGATVDEPL